MAPLPQVEFPTININAALPGASPETMASAVATPLERQFGRIANVTQMTSTSQLGSTSIVLQFDLNRNIDAAARDVQAAINAARGQLPTNLPSNPTWRKVNPADAPILILALTSETATKPQMYDVGSSILAQKLSQIDGVGQVFVGGSSLPAVRAEVNPLQLSNLGVGIEQVRTALSSANANSPKGELGDKQTAQLMNDNDQLFHAAQYGPQIVAYKNGAPVRLSDVSTVVDDVEDVHTAGVANGKPSVLIIIFRQPGANIIGTVDRVRALLPQLQASIPPPIKIDVVVDRTTTIRTSVRDVQITLIISVLLVIFVVFAFLRNVWATLIPSVAVPLSLIGTFGAMYLLGYSLDNLSLMALTISTGFVVDDAIVVIENITRHIEKGMTPVQAAYRGAKEIGFTVLSMSTSLIAVFIPILLMGGIVGRLFREFAVTLSVAVGISMVVSLTTTPMMCALFLKPEKKEKHNWIYRLSERGFEWMHEEYDAGLRWVLRHQPVMLLATFIDHWAGDLSLYRDSQGIFSAAGYRASERRNSGVAGYFVSVDAEEAVAIYSDHEGRSGGGKRGGIYRRAGSAEYRARVRVAEADRGAEAFGGPGDCAVARKDGEGPWRDAVLQAVQDVQIGGRQSNAQYQYTLQGDNLPDLMEFAPKLEQKLHTLKELRDISSDQQNHGLQASLVIDRHTASRLGLTPALIDNVLYDAFGQRQVSTMYEGINQYHVVMEVDPKFGQSPDSLKNIYVPSTNGTEVPLSAFTHYEQTQTSLAVSHQGQFPAVTFSFNLTPGVALGDAVKSITEVERTIGMPSSIHPSFQGTAQAFQDSLEERADFDFGGVGGGLYRVGHAVRELRPPDYDSFHAAFGGSGSAAGAC